MKRKLQALAVRVGKQGLVDDPDIRFTEQIDNHVGQATLRFFDIPGTVAHGVSPGLHFAPFDAGCYRLDRLALTAELQALHMDARPLAPAASTHPFEEVFERMYQPKPERFQGSPCHADNGPGSDFQINRYLNY